MIIHFISKFKEDSYEYGVALISATDDWHVPGGSEWNILENELGENACTKLKEIGGSGFNAKLAGYKTRLGNYYEINN